MASEKQQRVNVDEDCSIIALDKFILATRDSGYKGTASAISELVDNAIQAKAKTVWISIHSVGIEPHQELTVRIQDDGVGMDVFTLRQALRFGGSSRFGDRSGLGRYGMGLPNSSLSQARRVTVYSWQRGGRVHSTYLDVDEIAASSVSEVPVPRPAGLPEGAKETPSGTLVFWSHCDRLDNRRVGTIVRKLAAALGQTFRHFLWGDVKVLINGEAVKPIDPLFLQRERGEPVAEVFGAPLEYEVRASPENPRTGKVRVIFTELPLHAFRHLSNEEKRALGISKGAGVSVVRGGREVDYGWFFMGAKRRENYDDWFRCQVEFDPLLDEAFGITHTKQQIRPQQYLLDILSPDLEATAHALNGRIRKAHASMQLEQRLAESEKIAERCEGRLRPLTSRPTKDEAALSTALRRRHPTLKQEAPTGAAATRFRLVEDEKVAEFFTHARGDGQFLTAINPHHAFFKKVYRPLAESDDPRDKVLRGQLDLLLMAAARAAAALGPSAAATLKKFEKEWSDTLAAYLTA